eukprot:m.300112 g.300112  ORF g.300112 m.300112 type:complete len:471 (+) comp19553_c0_seq9:2118-3530(+)
MLCCFMEQPVHPKVPVFDLMVDVCMFLSSSNVDVHLICVQMKRYGLAAIVSDAGSYKHGHPTSSDAVCRHGRRVDTREMTRESRLREQPHRDVCRICSLDIERGKEAMATQASWRVVSYNVLSSSLARPSHFFKCTPQQLKSANRLEKLKKQLLEQFAQPNRPIVCLQEVSLAWAGELHALCAQQGYHVVSSMYGSPFNGHMGVALAWPTDVYDCQEVSIQRVSESRRWPRPAWSLANTVWSYISAPFGYALAFLRRVCGGTPARRPINVWTEAQSRANRMVMARLVRRETGAVAVVGTYHMPCLFWSPPFMVVHAALAGQCIQRFAKDSDERTMSKASVILTGDWNIVPGSGPYQMLTNGELSPDHPDYPTPQAGDKWQPKVTPMNSAYKTKLGREPEFTNYAASGGQVFIDCLDYIFCDRGVEVLDVLDIMDKESAEPSLPNDQHPSDHVMIAATLGVPNSTPVVSSI